MPVNETVRGQARLTLKKLCYIWKMFGIQHGMLNELSDRQLIRLIEHDSLFRIDERTLCTKFPMPELMPFRFVLLNKLQAYIGNYVGDKCINMNKL